MDDLEQKLFNHGMAGGHQKRPPRADPPPRERAFTIVSVDDHLLEPSDLFAGRLPTRLRDGTPRVIREDDIDYWVFDHGRFPVMGGDAFQSWESGEGYPGPVSYDDIRRGSWDIHARIVDMDINGVAASLNFPSGVFGFAGQRFLRMHDPDLGRACLMAYNDWISEIWCGTYPDRMIPCQVTWLGDPALAAAEVERNARRGFKALSFSENPEKLGLPSIYQKHWDPLWAACQDTGTVINLHVGSSSETLSPSTESPIGVVAALFPVNGLAAAADWLFAGIPVRFPRLKIAFSEGGIGWVPMLIDRLEYMHRYQSWESFGGLSPVEIMHRNYWYTTFSDPTTLALRHRVGVDRIMVETDYPHGDSSWPDSQAILASQLDGFPRSEIDLMTYGNAVDLYRHPLPR